MKNPHSSKTKSIAITSISQDTRIPFRIKQWNIVCSFWAVWQNLAKICHLACFLNSLATFSEHLFTIAWWVKFWNYFSKNIMLGKFCLLLAAKYWNNEAIWSHWFGEGSRCKGQTWYCYGNEQSLFVGWPAAWPDWAIFESSCKQSSLQK